MSQKGYDGQNDEFDGLNEFNTDHFVMKQMLRAVNTAMLVQVKAVSNSGTVDKIGTVDVLPLVHMMDAAGATTPHVNIQKIPYMRNVGGSKGIVLDPKVGDIGIAVFAQRDVQAALKAKAPSTPGSRRHHSMADGFFLTGFSADAPTSYVQFEDDGTVNISPDNGTTVVKVKANDVKAFIGTSYVELTPSKAKMNIGNTPVVVTNGRVDLGADPAPLGVMLAGSIVSGTVFGEP